MLLLAVPLALVLVVLAEDYFSVDNGQEEALFEEQDQPAQTAVVQVEELQQVHYRLLAIDAVAAVLGFLDSEGGEDRAEEESEGGEKERVLAEEPLGHRRPAAPAGLHVAEELVGHQFELLRLQPAPRVAHPPQLHVSRVQAALYGLQQQAVLRSRPLPTRTTLLWGVGVGSLSLQLGLRAARLRCCSASWSYSLERMFIAL